MPVLGWGMFVHLLLLLSYTNALPSGKQIVKYPIVLVPGDGGSQAFCKLKKSTSPPFPIWINLEYFLLPEILTKYFRAVYNSSTGEMFDNDVCEALFPGWGSTEYIENLDSSEHYVTIYFKPLVSNLMADKFYVRNTTLRGTPFDFRRSPTENRDFFPRLKSLIEETYANAGNLPVVLVGHSLGSIYCLELLKSQVDSWKEKYIKAFLSVSGPHGGSVKALKLEVSGDNFNIYVRNPLSFREVQRSLPSSAFLLPDTRLWPPSEPIIITPSVNYSAHDYERLFHDIDFKLGYEMWQNTRKSIDNFVGPTGIKELYCIHGSEVATTYQLIYYGHTFYRRAFPDQAPTLVFGGGDGTVHSRSLEVCRQWPGAKHIVLPGAEHVKIVGDSRFIDIVIQVAMTKG